MPASAYELPDVIPDWVLTDPFFHEEPRCDCGCSLLTVAEPPSEWAVPGCTGRITATEGLPEPSAEVAAFVEQLAALASVQPQALGGAQALADAQALLEAEQQLRLLDLRRIGDVGARGLHEQLGFRSAKAWLRQHRPDGDAADATLAAQLRALPTLRAAVEAGECPLVSARKVAAAVRRCAPHVDRRDGLIDGQPAQELLPAIVLNAFALLCRDLQGLHDDDPRLAPLLLEARALLAADGGELARLEAIFTWLARQLPSGALSAALEELVLSVLPSELERAGERGHARRGLTLRKHPDGTGWHVCGDLDVECGERFWTALRAEAARDPQKPADTSAWAELRAEAGGTLEPWDVAATAARADLESPRTKARRMHDALNGLLGRYLEQGLGGVLGKTPVQVSVAISEASLQGRAGAPPARGDSGALIPQSLVRRWWCDSRVSAYVLSLGGKALRVVHGKRTLSAAERRALSLEGGGRCAGEGCCPEAPDPLVVLRPHHVLGYAEDQVTSIEETLAVCDTLHHDLHDGHRTVRLRDGRYLNEHGFVDAPSLFDPPPF